MSPKKIQETIDYIESLGADRMHLINVISDMKDVIIDYNSNVTQIIECVDNINIFNISSIKEKVNTMRELQVQNLDKILSFSKKLKRNKSE